MEDLNGASNEAEDTDRAAPPVAVIASEGDVILDLFFEQSKETLRAARKANPLRRNLPPGQSSLRRKLRIPYRVHSGVLKRQSKYFARLLGDSRFEEARLVENSLAQLSLRNVRPEEADVQDLPWVKIVDDDEATRSTGRESAFGDLLRILHAQETTTKPPTMLYVVNLAVLADRFACVPAVAKYMTNRLKSFWPITLPKSTQADQPASLTPAAEETLRQKVLVSWLLNQPARFAAATRELILYGSSRWSIFPEESVEQLAVWWDLPEGLERELQFRRECILNTIASIPGHFLSLYSSRERQCTLGYDSSAACDSYQLGEAVRFLFRKDLLFPVDFGPKSLEAVSDFSRTDVGHFVATLKQCPSYQINKHHTNCGLRTRMMPALDYVQAMLSSNAISISRASWEKDRPATSWLAAKENSSDNSERTFLFTRSLAGDQRLRLEGAMAVDRFARDLFTATKWNWSPED